MSKPVMNKYKGFLMPCSKDANPIQYLLVVFPPCSPFQNTNLPSMAFGIMENFKQETLVANLLSKSELQSLKMDQPT